MFKGVDAFSGLDVEDADRIVIAPRRQVLVVRTEVQAGHALLPSQHVSYIVTDTSDP